MISRFHIFTIFICIIFVGCFYVDLEHEREIVYLIRERDNEKLTKRLKKFPKDLNKTEMKFLFYAAHYNNIDAAKMLLLMGVSPNEVSGLNNRSPLHAACENLNYELVNMLLDSGANPNYTDGGNYPPIYEALSTKNKDDKSQAMICILLIENGASLDIKGANNVTPRNLIYRKPQLKSMLLQKNLLSTENHQSIALSRPTAYENNLPLDLGLDNVEVYFLRSRSHPRLAEYYRALKIVNKTTNSEHIVELPNNVGGRTDLTVSIYNNENVKYLLLEDRWGKYVVNIETYFMVPIYPIQHDVVKQYEKVTSQAKMIAKIKEEKGELLYIRKDPMKRNE